MATPKTVWGIDVGQCALKALKLRSVDGQLQAEAFDVIEYPKMLCQPDADEPQLIRNALDQFLARHDVTGSQIAIAVPGRSSFTRFVKLPPVETKKVPDIVRFEAEQQIPFPIDEVTWRWQAFQNADSPDVEVGLFAMKRVDIDAAIEHFVEAELEVDVVQMAPLALYNFMVRDNQVASDGATLLADVGADKTDLVVADGSRIWTRTIQIGGRNFTEALEKAFKLSFNKAEKLKRTAATNKYARQVFQAMRPVFADLVQDIQRSIGYYTSLHREARFGQVLGLGNGFRLPGLQKFLQQSLGIPVTRVDNFNCLTPSATMNAPMFTENVLSFGVAYGLALQALEEAPVHTNLLPEQISRRRRWRRKRVWFAAAVAALVLVPACWLSSAMATRSAWGDAGDLNRATAIAKELDTKRKQYESLGAGSEQQRKQMEWYVELFQYRDVWPSIQEIISDSVRRVASDQWRLGNVTELAKIKRADRKIIIVEKLTSEYIADLSTLEQQSDSSVTAEAPARTNRPAGGRPSTSRGKSAKTKVNATKVRRGFRLRMEARATLPQGKALTRLITPLKQQSLELVGDSEFGLVRDPEWGWGHSAGSTGSSSGSSSGRPSSSGGLLGGADRGRPRGLLGVAGPMGVGRSAGSTGSTAADGPAMPDPLLPTEDMSNDTLFWMEWIIVLDEKQTPADDSATSGRSRVR